MMMTPKEKRYRCVLLRTTHSEYVCCAFSICRSVFCCSSACDLIIREKYDNVVCVGVVLWHRRNTFHYFLCGERDVVAEFPSVRIVFLTHDVQGENRNTTIFKHSSSNWTILI